MIITQRNKNPDIYPGFAFCAFFNGKWLFVFFILSLTVVESNAQIVNIENARLKENKNGWQGMIDFSSYTLKNVVTTFKMNNALRVQFKKNRHLVFMLNDVNLLYSTTTKFESNAFEHLRYGYKLDSNLTLESFAQNQYDQVQLIQSRILFGSGLRLRIVHGLKARFYIGSLYMFEREKELNQNHLETNHRLSNYANLFFKFGKTFSMLNTLYYQPRIDFWGDYRMTFNSTGFFKINKYVSFTFGSNFSFDSQPVDDPRVSKLVFKITNGLSIKI